MACDVSLERRERSRMRATLERYVSKDVVREIADNPDSYLQTLGGQRKEMVALFSDLKGFTSDSERLDPCRDGHASERIFPRNGGCGLRTLGHARQIHRRRAHGNLGRYSAGQSGGKCAQRGRGPRCP